MNIFAQVQNLKKIDYKVEILAGLTVAMTMIPESLSFAILAGLSPLIGLYGAVMMGIVTAIFGGRPGLISGGAGATIVVLIALINSHGVEYLFATLVLAGVIQFLVGALKFGKFIRLIPQPVMYGFLNGLACIIFMSQINQFKIQGTDQWLIGAPLYTMLGLTALTILVVYLFPKITKKIPASLVAILVVFAIVFFLNIETKTVANIANIEGSLPSFHFPMVPFTFETLEIIFPYALIMAGVGLIETLLTLTMVDEITNSKGSSNKEAMAQGGANILNGFFGGMGGCAMVAQTFVNLNSGSKTRVSGIVAAVAIMLIILIGAPFIQLIPMAALVGVMIMVSIGTFQWASFKGLRKMPKSDVIVSILVAVITVLLHNLALAVLVGVIISTLVFAWESSKRILIKSSLVNQETKVYEVSGPLFFGSITSFNESFSIKEDPKIVIVDFKYSRITDMSAIEAVHLLTSKYAKLDKRVILRHLSSDSILLLKNAQGIVEVNIDEDPTYKVMP